MLVLRQRHWQNPTAGRRAEVNGNCLLSFSLAPGAAAWSTWITERTCQSLKLREKLRTEVVFGHKGLFSLHLLHPVQAGQLTQQLLEVLQPRCKGRPLPGSAAHLNGFQGMQGVSGHAGCFRHECSARAVAARPACGSGPSDTHRHGPAPPASVLLQRPLHTLSEL